MAREIIQPTAQSVIGGSPYGDLQEVSGPPVLEVIPEEYGPFLRTDARTIMITLRPNHWNFIPNPAFRADASGWEITGTVSAPEAQYEELMGEDGAANRAAIEAVVAAAPEGSFIATTYNGATVSVVVDPLGTLADADVPYPLDSSISGARLWSATDDLAEDSWVGQSVAVSGEGTLRYRGTDKDGGQGFVYVGPSVRAYPGDDWQEPGRGSSQWTFSSYFKGRGRVRLVMESYRGADIEVLSPVQHLNAPVVADPSTQPYDSSVPSVIEEATGAVWDLMPTPHYIAVWRPVTETDPAAMTAQTDEYVLDGAGDLWRAISPVPASAPLYEKIGTPTIVTEPPLLIEPGDPYLIVQMSPPDPSRDGTLWVRTGPPYYQRGTSTALSGENAAVYGPWIEIGSDNDPQESWQRLIVQTDARGRSLGPNFQGCFWIDARVEFEAGQGLYISSLMLDPTEHPVAPYFDGGMVEDPAVDDFVWSDEAAPNNCISWYFQDRLARTRWLTQNMPLLVPVARPVQVFYTDWEHPFVPDDYESQPQQRSPKRSLTI